MAKTVTAQRLKWAIGRVVHTKLAYYMAFDADEPETWHTEEYAVQLDKAYKAAKANLDKVITEFLKQVPTNE